MVRHAIDFFETQFQRQVAAGEFALNPFEQLALPHLHGEVLDVGCGLGNLAIEAARRGCRVTALDGSPSAVDRIRAAAQAEGLAVDVRLADLAALGIDREYDSIVCIGLLMFFPEDTARAILADVVEHVRPGGHAVLNILAAGTTYRAMFEPDHYCLLAHGALKAALAGWEIVAEVHDSFPAPGDTLKVFDTIVARKPLP